MTYIYEREKSDSGIPSHSHPPKWTRVNPSLLTYTNPVSKQFILFMTFSTMIITQGVLNRTMTHRSIKIIDLRSLRYRILDYPPENTITGYYNLNQNYRYKSRRIVRTHLYIGVDSSTQNRITPCIYNWHISEDDRTIHKIKQHVINSTNE